MSFIFLSKSSNIAALSERSKGFSLEAFSCKYSTTASIIFFWLSSTSVTYEINSVLSYSFATAVLYSALLTHLFSSFLYNIAEVVRA